MPSPDELERQHTLLTAAARYETLRRRELDAGLGSRVEDGLADGLADDREEAHGSALTSESALELLALSEVLARKAAYGRQLTMRTARVGGASWAQIGQALGTSRQAAWESHRRWIEEQAARSEVVAHEGLDAAEADAARALAGADSDR